jgi:predicted nuclease with RNAse H fold
VHRSFIGIDLGGGKGKHTGVARLTLGSEPGAPLEVRFVATAIGGEPFHDDPLCAFLGEHRDAIVAIDAPLTLPACGRCRLPACPGVEACVDSAVVWLRGAAGEIRASEPGRRKPAITPYTQRATEIILQRDHGIVPRETLGQGMGPLTARAVHLVKRLEQLGFRHLRDLIEVYPRATLHRLFGERVARRYRRQPGTWETRAGVLESLGPSLVFAAGSGFAREACLENDHCFDALISAYTAYLYERDGWTIPEGIFATDGWIWVP